jgi:hypothetical protein
MNYHKSDNIISRNVGGEILLVPIVRTPTGLKCIYSLSGKVEKRIWALINSGKSAEQTVKTLTREFDADPKRIRGDAEKFIKKLLAEGIIEKDKA